MSGTGVFIATEEDGSEWVSLANYQDCLKLYQASLVALAAEKTAHGVTRERLVAS